ncbi:MAG: ankyrin repeat domain-containing protein, partial [Candidatus Zixiibacteriota bacterium]
YYAAREGKLNMVKLLIEKGAEVDLQRRAIIHVDTTMYARTDSGNTALTIAVVKNKKDVALYLLSKGADPNRSVVYEDAPFEVSFGNPYTHKGQFTLYGAPGVINHKSGTALEIAKALKWREWLPAAVDSMKAAGDSLKTEGGGQ